MEGERMHVRVNGTSEYAHRSIYLNVHSPPACVPACPPSLLPTAASLSVYADDVRKRY